MEYFEVLISNKNGLKKEDSILVRRKGYHPWKPQGRRTNMRNLECVMWWTDAFSLSRINTGPGGCSHRPQAARARGYKHLEQIGEPTCCFCGCAAFPPFQGRDVFRWIAINKFETVRSGGLLASAMDPLAIDLMNGKGEGKKGVNRLSQW